MPLSSRLRERERRKRKTTMPIATKMISAPTATRPSTIGLRLLIWSRNIIYPQDNREASLLGLRLLRAVHSDFAKSLVSNAAEKQRQSNALAYLREDGSKGTMRKSRINQ